MNKRNCPICGSTMSKGLKSWHLECGTCLYEFGELAPCINEANNHKNINEKLRSDSLNYIRNKNFNTLLCVIKESGRINGKILDVGCAHGWFLGAAKKSGFDAVGIEPDINLYNLAIENGCQVKNGYFPQVLTANETFDVIIFNDVFEHINDSASILKDSYKHLSSDGLLILNLPSSSGFFYSIARILCKIGISGPFERLWQVGLPSPHLHYFNRMNLQKLLMSNGFELASSGTLDTIGIKGLYERISYAGKKSAISNFLIYLFVLLCIPMLSFTSSDIFYIVSKKNDSN